MNRHLTVTNQYQHSSGDQTIDERQQIPSLPSIIPPLPMPLMDSMSTEPEHSVILRDQFSIDALAFITSAVDAYQVYRLKICCLIKKIFSNYF